MANQQPPARPWLRLSSIARQTPAPEPPPSLTRPPFRPNAPPPPQAPSTPTFPIPRVSASTSSPQSSPQQKQPITRPPPAAAAQVPSTTKSPQSSPQQKQPITPPAAATQVPSTTKSPQSSPQQKQPITPPSPAAAAAAQVPPTTKSPQSSPQQKQSISTTSSLKFSSPKPRPLISDQKYSPSPSTPPRSPQIKLAPPPSPLTLPPSQMKSDTELEPKFPPEVEQKNVLVHKTVEKANDNNPEITRNVNPKGKLNKNKSDSKEGGMRVISIAGDNRGAIMDLSPSPMKNGSYSTSNDQGKEDISREKKNTMESHGMMNGYMNSNVQGVNNSIIFNSAYVDHDPGLHLSFNGKALGGGLHKNHKNG